MGGERLAELGHVLEERPEVGERIGGGEVPDLAAGVADVVLDLRLDEFPLCLGELDAFECAEVALQVKGEGILRVGGVIVDDIGEIELVLVAIELHDDGNNELEGAAGLGEFFATLL